MCGVDKQHNASWQEYHSSFRVTGCRSEKGRYGDVAILTAQSSELPLEIQISYEASDELPLFRKSVKIKNIGNELVTVENIAVEIFYGSHVDRLVQF